VTDESMICVKNNVDWYRAIFESHGLSGEIADGVWFSRDTAPPYYSNAVTLTPSAQEQQVARLRDLDGVLRRRWSVKDSFAALDLSPFGFRLLFEAEWIWCAASDAPAGEERGVTWRPVTTTDQLEDWETAWREDGSPTDTRVFLPQLLTNATISLFGGYRDGVLVGGCAGNRSADAVGFSNFFVARGHEAVAMPGAIGAVARFGGGLPIVGYLAGEGLARMRDLGFGTVGPLRVWLSGH
jgi:hypothetical protein